MDRPDFANNLKIKGLKSTRHRLAILEILEKSSQPIAAEQLFQKMKEMNITVDLSTVYRTLDTLCDKSLVKKINIDSDSRALYEYNRMLHTHYLVCLGCKKITAIKGCPLEDYEKNLAIETDYTIAGHKLDIYGYCPKCRNARSAGGSVK